MDFDLLLKNYQSKTCIISVQKNGDDSYSDIRIAAGNKAHCDEMAAVSGKPFVPGSPYDLYFPKNLNFEDYCYRCAVKGQPLHAYVSLYAMGLWLNMFLVPLQSDRDDLGYCIYTYEVTPDPNTEAMSDLSSETSKNVLKTCVKLRTSDDFSAAMQDVVEDIRRICDSDKCCLLLTDDDTQSCHVLGDAIREGSGLRPLSEHLPEHFYHVAKHWEDMLNGSTCIIIKDEQDMQRIEERDPKWHATLVRAGIRSIVLFPLKYKEQWLGYMWAINFNTENTVKIKETLELTTFFIASEVANQQLLHKLRVLSSIDNLTGIKNRNIMNNMIDEIVKGRVKMDKPYAVVFLDLNGLKEINDTLGHSAGDNLLRSAASILQQVFCDDAIYRAGGDEFMIIAEDTTQPDMDEKIRQLRELTAGNSEVKFAVGVCCCRKGEDIRSAMHTADERMYEDKKAFYDANPEKKYR